ncbi:MAG: hypothetical protein JJU10_07680 [Idiomarina sp.]|nr:hypothetical protein [Idiomarina sp.]
MKIFSVICEKPFLGSDFSDNPSVSWMLRNAPGEVVTLMRGTKKSQAVLSLPDSASTLGLIKKIITSRASFMEVKGIFSQSIEMALKSDLIWVRGPGLLPIIFSSCFRPKVSKKSIIHLCANRLTFHYLVGNFSVGNLLRFLYGLTLILLMKYLALTGARFCYTGSQVKHNFRLPDSSSYIIDFLPKFSHPPVVVNSGTNSEIKCIALGRLSKFNNNSELQRFIEVSGAVIDIYGPGDSSTFNHGGGLQYCGAVKPSNVADVMDTYAALACISLEYYEGFPRVIAEAINAGKWVIVSMHSTFFKDVQQYPRLIVSECVVGPFSFYSSPNSSIVDFWHQIQSRAQIEFI